jgi:hypothetical protein
MPKLFIRLIFVEAAGGWSIGPTSENAARAEGLNE